MPELSFNLITLVFLVAIWQILRTCYYDILLAILFFNFKTVVNDSKLLNNLKTSLKNSITPSLFLEMVLTIIIVIQLIFWGYMLTAITLWITMFIEITFILFFNFKLKNDGIKK